MKPNRAPAPPPAAPEEDHRLMCTAHGCPNRWSVDDGTRMCSAHYHAPFADWPAVTQAQQWAETDRAQAAANSDLMPPKVRDPGAPLLAPVHAALSAEQKQRVREGFAKLIRADRGGRAWALDLQVRDDRGDSITPTQRTMYRDALAGVGGGSV